MSAVCVPLSFSPRRRLAFITDVALSSSRPLSYKLKVKTSFPTCFSGVVEIECVPFPPPVVTLRAS